MACEHSTSSRVAQLAARIPKRTWDTHMHVVDPRTFRLAKNAQYQAQPHTLDQAKAFLSQLGIERMIIVQPSIYGNDNGCTLDGLRTLGLTHGRAVVQFDPETTSAAQLREWHDLGVRGVRLNFKSVGAKLEQTSLIAELQKYADVVRPLGWVLDLYIAIEDIPLLEAAMAELGEVKVCIAHLGHPSATSLDAARDAEAMPGSHSVARLLKQGQTWVKLSGTYRISQDPRHPLVSSLMREVLKLRPDRCVFATDWPHTRFDGLDVAPYLEAICDCIEAEGVPLQQVLVDNAELLFDGKDQSV
ncbi:hypothetical protein BAUCODRAFT_64998 [Baudoinia panamericana UAMH 10762]|uniref:Amidohydrolase-related domain-containing protein n=1 Tax=Baudoinia panamericana (strain UAMH 10762) TaxID=717646 RepID=M2N5C0_BAUPA|nr:uncharacterized protein BAUCODRAFT_64998 [Baudoinia panamericana UAMH 10762]EMC99228.1 hypothetical protein BAUCODRAFT_64998 [Baudoinia panamericana UAMH 10762]